VIDSFENLLDATLNTDFAPLYAELSDTPDLTVDTLVPGEVIHTRGTQAYARSKGESTCA